MGIAVVSVQAPHYLQSFQFCPSKSRQFHGSTTLKIHQTKSSLNLRCSASVVEEGPPPPIESDSAINEDSGKLPFSGCKACGREEVEKGCNGEGRIQGGIATIPGFGWWPIKAYRPCPGFVASGGRYRRRGQSMDEVAFGRGPVETSSEDQSREQRKDPKMEAEMEQRIEKTVQNILESSNMDDVTEYRIRKQASEELALDLSKPPYKAFVRQVVQSFLEKQQQKQEQEEEEAEEEEEEDEQKRNGRDYDDEGNLIICKLSEKRKVTIQDFRGKTLVSIREYFKKDGKELPTFKGISLTQEQWSVFQKNVPAIEKAIRKMESR